MTWQHYLGALAVLAVVAAVGVAGGRAVKSADDFTSGGHKAGVALVAGAMLGTIIGGASTFGTAQLAYTNGLSAWWFTLGAGLGAILLFCLTPRLYNSGLTTLTGLVGAQSGRSAAALMAVLSSGGIFLSLVAQMLSGMNLVAAVAGAIPPAGAVALIVALVICYVLFGGVLSAGRSGLVKTCLIVTTVAVSGVAGLALVGGLGALWRDPALPHAQFFDLFGRGAGIELGSAASLLFGVASEQAYFQAIVSGKTLRHSRLGIGLAAFLMPVVGGLGVAVGLVMRATHPGIASGLALPLFILDYLPPLAAGAMLATLLIVVVGSSAGITFGISTILVKDLLLPARSRLLGRDSRVSVTAWTRAVLVIVLGLGAAVALTDVGGAIMDWSFLALGLRASISFFPLAAALFFPGRVKRAHVVAAMLAGPLGTLLGYFTLPAGVDPVLLGLALAALTVATGIRRAAPAA
jgi:SSS family solute:Na+ symporter